MSGIFAYNRNLVIHNLREYLGKTTYSKEVQAVMIEHFLQALDANMSELSKELKTFNYFRLQGLMFFIYLDKNLGEDLLKADSKFELAPGLGRPITAQEINGLLQFAMKEGLKIGFDITTGLIEEKKLDPNLDTLLAPVFEMSPSLKNIYLTGNATMKDLVEQQPESLLLQ